MESEKTEAAGVETADAAGSEMNEFVLTASEVRQKIEGFDYQIIRRSRLCAQLREKGMIAMPVETARESDLVTDDIAAFLHTVSLNGVTAVMYHFDFYTPENVEAHFRLSQADRTFFRSTPEHDDLGDYKRYAEFAKSVIDPECPKHVVLYALLDTKLLVCKVDDLWLEKLPLPNAQTIRKLCVDSMSYTDGTVREVRFCFRDDTAAPEPVPDVSGTAETSGSTPPESSPAQEPAPKAKNSRKKRKRRNKGK